MASSTKVEIKQGTVIGGEGCLPNGNVYYYFKGIPYAVPPLGELRFKAPVPLERFSTPEIDCTKEGAVSYQKDGFTGKIVGSEDCLFLNVYAPKINVGGIRLPVMVYIHGGGFTFGSGNSDLYNPLYLMQEQVIVVTLNYRVGVLGFLSLPEGNIPGNAGLKDQRLALQWVKENIAHFNGDPNNVTLVGHSAGGACAHLHVLSENSRKLFHKAIIQSGLGNMSWAIDDQASDKTKKLAKILGCTSDDPFEIVKFLQNYKELANFINPPGLPPKQIIEQVLYGHSIPVIPVIEKENPEAVVPKAPLESMNDENSIDIPLMIGYTSAEAIVILPVLIDNLVDYNDLRQIVPKNLNLKSEDPRSIDYAKSLREFYFKGENVNKTTLSNFNDLLGDISFVVDSNVAAEVHSRKQHQSPLFFYRFDYDGSLNLYKNKIFNVKDVKGASHADELFYIFQATMAPEPWEDEAKQMVQTMCKLWANFTKYGNPTPERERRIVDCTWEPVKKISDTDKFTLNAFVIDKNSKMLENPDEERIAFWRNIRKTYNS